jgi:hypothetical protein
MCQTSIRLQHESMILRRDAVADLENVAKVSVGSRATVVRERPRLSGEWSIDDAYSSLRSCRTKVRIDERGQVLSIAKEIARGDNRVTRDLAFDDHVALMNQRVLEAVSKIINGRSSRRR